MLPAVDCDNIRTNPSPESAKSCKVQRIDSGRTLPFQLRSRGPSLIGGLATRPAPRDHSPPIAVRQRLDGRRLDSLMPRPRALAGSRGISKRLEPESNSSASSRQTHPTIAEYGARKAALRRQVAAAGHKALMVFAADKISKVRELRLDPAPAAGSHHLPEAPPSRQQRLTHFHHCLESSSKTLSAARRSSSRCGWSSRACPARPAGRR
jgi:hypothetical protein